MSGIHLASSHDGQVGHSFLVDARQVLGSLFHGPLNQTEFQLLQESGEYLQYLNHRVTKISGIHKYFATPFVPQQKAHHHIRRSRKDKTIE